MGRPKIENPKDEIIMVRMDKKLRVQLERQAVGKGKIARTARKAIEMYLEDNKLK